jgi:hypothetical protein
MCANGQKQWSKGEVCVWGFLKGGGAAGVSACVNDANVRGLGQ